MTVLLFLADGHILFSDSELEITHYLRINCSLLCAAIAKDISNISNVTCVC